jgi:hypothetical protein
MPAQRVELGRGALPEPVIMIMQFDPSNAEMTKFGDTYASSEFNRGEAQRDAEAAAQQAVSKGLSMQYIVVHVESIAAFTSYQMPG